jgi:hypothetical protein
MFVTELQGILNIFVGKCARVLWYYAFFNLYRFSFKGRCYIHPIILYFRCIFQTIRFREWSIPNRKFCRDYAPISLQLQLLLINPSLKSA